MNRGDTWGGNFCASRLIRDGGSSSVGRFFVVGTLFRTKQKGDEAAEALIRSTRCSLRCFHRFALSFFISPGKMSFPSSALLTKNLRTPFIRRKFKSLVTYMFFTSSILFTSSELKMVQPLRGVGPLRGRWVESIELEQSEGTCAERPCCRHCASGTRSPAPRSGAAARCRGWQLGTAPKRASEKSKTTSTAV